MYIANTISGLTCDRCDRPVREFSVPDEVWDAVVRSSGLDAGDQYLCVWCFVELASQYVQKDLRSETEKETLIVSRHSGTWRP